MSLSGSKKHLFTFHYVNEIYFARVCTTSTTQTRFILVERLPELTYNNGGLKVTLPVSCTIVGVNKYSHWA